MGQIKPVGQGRGHDTHPCTHNAMLAWKNISMSRATRASQDTHAAQDSYPDSPAITRMRLSAGWTDDVTCDMDVPVDDYEIEVVAEVLDEVVVYELNTEDCVRRLNHPALDQRRAIRQRTGFHEWGRSACAHGGNEFMTYQTVATRDLRNVRSFVYFWK